MKPSEGILIGAQIRPQGFDRLFTDNDGVICSCVWGAFLEANRPDAFQFAAYYVNDMPDVRELNLYVDVGIDLRTLLTLEQKYDLLKFLRSDNSYVDYDVPITYFDGNTLLEIGIKLNDYYKVPRERIAALFASWGM